MTDKAVDLFQTLAILFIAISLILHKNGGGHD